MLWLLTLLLAAVTIRDPRTPLRAGCDSDSGEVAALDAGTPVAIKFAMAGQGCYKVAAAEGGEIKEGYVDARALDGLDEFEKLRKDAAWLDAVSVVRDAAKPSPAALGLSGTANPKLAQAAQMIESSQPSRALELLEAELRSKPRRDPSLLALAGVAAWRSDDPRRALDYWKTSLDIQPNADLARLYKRVERETANDRSYEKLLGLRVSLRYEPGAVSAENARAMVGILDEEFARIVAQVGCPVDERIAAIVQSRDAYMKATDAAEWSGGQFDGRIRVPVMDTRSTPEQMRRVFAHETTHACLSIMGRWPAWFHEGLAQRLSGETLAPAQRRLIEQMAAQKTLPRLENLRQDWSRMSTQHAQVAYAMSLAAVELFFEHWSAYGLRNLVRNPEQLAKITADIDRRLGL